MSVIHRTFDATFLNTVANHKDVRPWIGGVGEIDLSAIIANPVNLAITAPHGGWVLVQHEPGIYDLHTMFLKKGRGKAHFEAAAEGLRYVFTRTDAREIVTRVPVNNPAAIFTSQRLGFVERFARKDAFVPPDGVPVDVSYQCLTIDRWAAMSAEAVIEGEWFHREIEAAKVAFKSQLPDHPEDAAHDIAAGVSVMMIKAGNVRKGVWFYNRWARLAGYDVITLLSDAPPILNVGAGVIVEVRDGTMEVLQCP